ncbi:hypothetical protein DMENIID0001_142050 [Sergentomyia squamirostris]
MCETDLNNRSFDSFLADEFPKFSMRDFCNGERSPSPINTTPNNSIESPSNQDLSLNSSTESIAKSENDCDMGFVSIENVDASISPQETQETPRENLETIFEDVLLDTPTRRKYQQNSMIRKAVHRRFLENSPDGFTATVYPDSPSGSPLRKRSKNK